MARTPSPFKPIVLTQAVKASRAVGLEVERTEIAPDGSIVLVYKAGTVSVPLDMETASIPPGEGRNPWDDVTK
jgi:hypothetical protein